ncbi:MAG: lipase family protein [Acidimicrobiales bacterium]
MLATVLGLTVASLAACSSAPTAPAEGPPGLPSFYSVPASLPSTALGTLIKSQLVPSDGIQGHVYRVMYVSEDVNGHPTVVTGLVMVPDTPPPAGGYPVVTWGHGTNGMADQCAPSLDPSQAVPLQNQLLSQGWVVTASDYQGEGTPGLLPYLVGVVAARNTIDIVRASRHLPVAHASAHYVVWGHSEGGQTAMFALAIGDSYAPDLDLEGVVAGAPPSQFQDVYAFLKTSPFRYYLLMAGAGFHVAYGSAAPLSEVLTPKGLALLPVLGKGCADEIAKATNSYPLDEILKADPFTFPAWRTLLMANDPGDLTAPSTASLLIIQGGADEQIPVPTTALLEQHECSIGQQVERWIYPGQDHSGVISVSMGDMVQWISDRFVGRLDAVGPVGEPDVQVTSCAS